MHDRITQWIRPALRALKCYAAPAADGMIKLDAMESPYPWPPPELLSQWSQAMSQVPLQRYPDAQACALKAGLRKTLKIPDSVGLMLGNGSDELIQLLMQTIGSDRDTVLSLTPSFSMYAQIAVSCNRRFATVALDASDFSLPEARLLAHVAQLKPAIIFIAYPNNPTGNLFDRNTLDALLAAAPGVVVIDEAYSAFTEHSFLPALQRYPNLLLLRTMSKTGLAGIRLGLLMGHPQWLVEIEKCRLPYNINSLTQAAALFALRHNTILQQQAQRICAERARLSVQLAQRIGVRVWPSAANFILLRTLPGRGARIHHAMCKHGVLVKHLGQAADRLLADCLRITVATPSENERLLEALDAALQEAEAAPASTLL